MLDFNKKFKSNIRIIDLIDDKHIEYKAKTFRCKMFV